MRQGDAGDIITGWLLQLLVTMAVLGFVGYEVLSVGITAVTLEDTAREVAVVGRDAYRGDQDLAVATRAARQAADDRAIGLESLSVDGDDVVVVVEKQARTLVAHRIGFLSDVTSLSATGRAAWRP